jgi:hypothetical protein
LGKENASALMILFGFLYTNSIPLANLLERVELFGVSPDIVEQLGSALSDLVTLVASVAIHFQGAIRNKSTRSVSVNIYSTFSSQIKSFREGCEKVAMSMWRHQVTAEEMDHDAGIAPLPPPAPLPPTSFLRFSFFLFLFFSVMFILSFTQTCTCHVQVLV